MTGNKNKPVIGEKEGTKMALFEETFVQEINKLVRRRHQELSAALGQVVMANGQESLSADAPLRRDLELMMSVANGEYIRGRASQPLLRDVEEALKNVVDLLFGNALHAPLNIPDAFWSTDAGIL